MTDRRDRWAWRAGSRRCRPARARAAEHSPTAGSGQLSSVSQKAVRPSLTPSRQPTWRGRRRKRHVVEVGCVREGRGGRLELVDPPVEETGAVAAAAQATVADFGGGHEVDGRHFMVPGRTVHRGGDSTHDCRMQLLPLVLKVTSTHWPSAVLKSNRLR